jgi:F-type H+-transporting ATPase subunit delta
MASGTVVLQRYANALLELARDAGTQEQVEAELGALDEMLAENADLRANLGNPRITREVKRNVLIALLGDGASDLVKRTVLLLADKGRAGLLPEFAAVFNEVAMKAAGRAIARVETATPLDDEQRNHIRENLSRVTGQEVSLDETVEESLLGGLRVTIGSRMIDGSLKRRLEKLQDQMLRAPLAQD